MSNFVLIVKWIIWGNSHLRHSLPHPHSAETQNSLTLITFIFQKTNITSPWERELARRREKGKKRRTKPSFQPHFQLNVAHHSIFFHSYHYIWRLENITTQLIHFLSFISTPFSKNNKAWGWFGARFLGFACHLEEFLRVILVLHCWLRSWRRDFEAWNRVLVIWGKRGLLKFYHNYLIKNMKSNKLYYLYIQTIGLGF